MQSLHLRINERPTITALEIAENLGWSLGTFQHKLKTLQSDKAFPARLPGGNFSRVQFLTWLESYERAEQAPIIELNAAIIQRAQIEASIDARRIV